MAKRDVDDDNISSSEIEKDIEAGISAGGKGGCGNETNSISSVSTSDYDEGIRRISTVVDPEVTRTTTRASRASGKTSKDLEAVLNTEFEVKWDGPDDPRNALNWPSSRKYAILALVSLQTWMVYVDLFFLHCGEGEED